MTGIATVATAVSRIGIEPTANELADALWLAVHLRISRSVPSTTEQTAEPSSSIDSLPPVQQDAESRTPTPKPQSTSPADTANLSRSELFPQRTAVGGIPQAGAQLFRSPTGAALPGSLELARALRPLKRRVPSRTSLVFDESTTVEKVANEGIWNPELRPSSERWFDVALVVDEGASMVIWRETILEFQRLLERQGAFNDVRMWGLHTNSPKEIALCAGIGLPPSQRRIRSPRELIDPRGRRLILVVTDCVSPAWRAGSVTPLLAVWAKRGPTAILQVLGPRLWPGTWLNNAVLVPLHAPAPGVPNSRLALTAADYWMEAYSASSLRLPISALEPKSVATWARMVALPGDSRTLGALMPMSDTISTLYPSPDRSEVAAPLTALERVRAFQATASPLARKLARYLAAAPLTLPVMRLVQQTMLPESRQIHLAEVFLSGLMRQVDVPDQGLDPDAFLYDFHQDVRSLLQDSLEVPDALNVLSVVSDHLSRRIDHPLDFQALLSDPSAPTRIPLDEHSRPFATVAASVLRRLGGDYLGLAERLDGSSTDQAISAQMEAPYDMSAPSSDETLSRGDKEDLQEGKMEMALGEQVWFVPLDDRTGELQSAYYSAPDDRKITDAQAFTISLDTVMIPKQHVQLGLWPQLVGLLRRDFNILIASTTMVGSEPGVQRVHYFGPAGQFEVPFTSFISDTIYLTPDFHPLKEIHLTLQVFAADMGTAERAGLLQAFNGLATTAGAVFPVILPYSSVVAGVAAAANKLLDTLVPQQTTRISDVIKLYPAGKRDDFDLQEGRYVVVDKDRDLATYSLGADEKLRSGDKEVLDTPYIVFRLQRGQAPSPDFVVWQRVATLLTQMTGAPSDPMKSSIEFLTDTMKDYANFQDLRRYRELLRKKNGDSRGLSYAEEAVMQRIEGNPDLQDFLPV